MTETSDMIINLTMIQALIIILLTMMTMMTIEILSEKKASIWNLANPDGGRCTTAALIALIVDFVAYFSRC